MHVITLKLVQNSAIYYLTMLRAIYCLFFKFPTLTPPTLQKYPYSLAALNTDNNM